MSSNGVVRRWPGCTAPVDRRHYQVFEHRDVARVDDFGVNLERLHFHATRDLDRDGATARRAGCNAFLKLLLRLCQFLLHLSELRKHVSVHWYSSSPLRIRAPIS